MIKKIFSRKEEVARLLEEKILDSREQGNWELCKELLDILDQENELQFKEWMKGHDMGWLSAMLGLGVAIVIFRKLR